MLHKLFILAAAMFIAIPPVAAQNYPTRPVRFIVPFAPGGNTDVQGRLIAQKLSEIWNQQVVVDNRSGAGGTLGVEILSKAPADGHTIALASFGNILVGPSLFTKLGYDPMKDLAPVVLVSQPPGLLVVNPGLPVKNISDLVAYAKANPGALNYGSAGNGTWNHMLSGQIQLSFAPIPVAMPQIKAGRLRVLGVTSAQRSSLLPDVPTVAEMGLPGYSAASWFAVMAPAKTPAAVISKLNRDINAVLLMPEVRAAFAADGTEPAGGTPEQLRESMISGIKQWGELVRKLGVKL